MNDSRKSQPMHCEQLTENGAALQSAEKELPEPAGTEVLLKIGHCGVCHSDLHLQDGYFDLGNDRRLDVSAQRKLPLTLGHEIAGHVVACGPDAPQELIGKFVAAYPWIGCGNCDLCRRGDEQLCDKPRVLGINVDGGFASHVVVPSPRYLLDLEGIESTSAGCLMCSGLTAYSAVRKAQRFLAAGPLVIIGLGGVGLMALRFALARKIEPVYAIDTSPAARESATSIGATAVFDPADGDVRKSLFSAMGGGAGAVIDFVGNGNTVTLGQRVAAKGGGIIVVGLMGGSFSTPVPMLPFTSLTIQGSYVGSLEEAQEMLDFVRTGAVEAIPVDERPLKHANAALDSLREGAVVGRVVLRP